MTYDFGDWAASTHGRITGRYWWHAIHNDGREVLFLCPRYCSMRRLIQRGKRALRRVHLA